MGLILLAFIEAAALLLLDFLPSSPIFGAFYCESLCISWDSNFAKGTWPLWGFRAVKARVILLINWPDARIICDYSELFQFVWMLWRHQLHDVIRRTGWADLRQVLQTSSPDDVMKLMTSELSQYTDVIRSSTSSAADVTSKNWWRQSCLKFV